MTGFGNALFENERFSVSIEIKTLNSKFLETNLRLPRIFADKEQEVRTMIADALERGKVNVSTEFVSKEDITPKVEINEALFQNYYTTFERLATSVGAKDQDLFKLALTQPEVMVSNAGNSSYEEEWKVFAKVMQEALLKCNDFRETEGSKLIGKLLGYIESINSSLEAVSAHDPQRVQHVRDRIRQNLKEVVEESKVDENRFEQELIYYIEKLDIAEEKVRLKSHLQYFEETAKQDLSNPGKKLGFICQEIGREINTIGSKANDAHIQRHVVNMKEELEKIKEQVLNLV